MTDDEITRDIEQLDPDQQPAVDDLARNLEEQAHAPIRAVVRAWANPDAQLSGNAAVVMDELGELPIVPLLGAEGELPPEKQMWRMQSVVAREQDLRERIETTLESMLDDKRPVSLSVTGGREEERRPPPRRVCDEAYMQLRLLVNADPDEETYYLNVDAFLDMPDQQRDAEIEKARSPREWTHFDEL